MLSKSNRNLALVLALTKLAIELNVALALGRWQILNAILYEYPKPVLHTDPVQLSHHHEDSKHEKPGRTRPHHSKDSRSKKAAHAGHKNQASHDDHKSHDRAS